MRKTPSFASTKKIQSINMSAVNLQEVHDFLIEVLHSPKTLPPIVNRGPPTH